MAEPTHTPSGAGSPRTIGWCAWHQEFADTLRVISVEEQGSGSGGYRLACQPCIAKHGLTPFADR
ncbi:hypothetical protein CJI59_35580 [Streptomyces sp. Alain-F2R5]|nr:hypothetical protein [Streptomyces sp. Alain-F2R5]PAM97253.1 hypothetical protein CJI59_35580 [Streptomyces sp. Alain-F2R5]